MLPTDRELMLRVQAGEHELFAQLVDRFRTRLLRFAASKIGNRALAEDLVQDTFLSVFVSRASYDPQFAFSTWIWTILLNVCRKALARRSRASAVHLPPRADLVATNGDEDREELLSWLTTIPEAEADAVRLRFFGELPFEEIAAAMDSSVSGAKVRVRRGLERLSELARTERDQSATEPRPRTGSES